MEHEAITLTDEQKEFIIERFVLGETLFNRVTLFADVRERVALGDHVCRTGIHINTDTADGVTVHPRYLSSLAWLIAYPDEVLIEFKKEDETMLTLGNFLGPTTTSLNKTHAVGETGMPKEETKQ